MFVEPLNVIGKLFTPLPVKIFVVNVIGKLCATVPKKSFIPPVSSIGKLFVGGGGLSPIFKLNNLNPDKLIDINISLFYFYIYQNTTTEIYIN